MRAQEFIIEMNRRGFLKGLAGFAASAAVPSSVVKLLSTPAGVSSLSTTAGVSALGIEAGLALLTGIRKHLDQYRAEDDDAYFEAWEDMAARLGFNATDAKGNYHDPLSDLLKVYRKNPEQAAQQLIKHVQRQSINPADVKSSFQPRDDWRYHARKNREEPELTGGYGDKPAASAQPSVSNVATVPGTLARAATMAKAGVDKLSNLGKNMGLGRQVKATPALSAPTKPEIELPVNVKQKQAEPIKRQGNDVAEARRNPELNPKRSGREEAVEFLRSAMGRSGAWGVSFTQVNKLGINPATGFNSGALNAGTPAGVYFYPASYFVRTVEAKESFPFADHANFIQVFSYNPKHLLNLKTATSYEEETVNKKLGQSDYDDTGMGAGPNIMMSVASYVQNHPGATSETWELHRVFRKLGYDAILDLGTGYIQEQEPYCGVILDTGIIGQVKTFNNIQPKQGVAESATVERNGITLKYQFGANKQKLKIVALSNGRQLGSAEFQNYGPADQPQYKGDQVDVDERYRGQGIATVMYDLARELVGRIYPSPSQTADGEAFWKGKPVWEQEQLTEFDPGEGGFGPFKVYYEQDYFIGQFPTYEEAKDEVDFLRDSDPKSATHHWRIVDGTGETVWEYDIGDDIDAWRRGQKFQKRP